MIFHPTPLPGAWVLEVQKREDERGFFARAYCQREMAEHGLDLRFVQVNDNFSTQRGTLRGMHYQLAPHGETKLVRCIRGSLYDVVLDMRPDSSTFGQSFGVELTADNRKMVLVPKGFAHGLITLEANTEAFYLVDEFYAPEAERGVRWDDPRFGIKWPLAPTVVSDRDSQHPMFKPAWHLGA